MRRLALALTILLAATGLARAAEQPVDLELVLAVDVSRSIDTNEALLQRQGYIEAFRDPAVIRAIQSGFLQRIAVTYMDWAGTYHRQVVVGWTVIDGEESARAFAESLDWVIPASAYRTSISGAIEFALPLFDANGFEGTRRVIDVSGDGPNNGGRLVVVARDEAIAAGVTINGLPILDQSNDAYSWYSIPELDLYYRDCVIGGPAAFMVVAANFQDFARAVRRKLILEIAGATPRQSARLIRAQARTPPPCDIGEQLRRARDWDD
ncbi:MAG: DUF1194 domain-containing protein [Alphaproteobacteria bacterium]